MEPRAKVLIVEDDESQRLLYSEELREEGYGDFLSWTADAYLVKSSDLTELKETVKRLIGQRRGDIQQTGSHSEKGTVKKAVR